MSKFTDADQETLDLFERVKKGFPDIEHAQFKLLFRTNKKGSDDFIVLAEICTFSSLVKYITSQIPGLEDEGLHYCIIIDFNVWNVIDEADKWRILRHELLHAAVKFKDDGSIEYTTRKHTVESFHEEIDIESKNTSECDPRWKEKLATTAISLYDEIKEKEKEEKSKKKKYN